MNRICKLYRALLHWLKAACKEEIWLVCLILPLVFLAGANMLQLTRAQFGATHLPAQTTAINDLSQQDITANEVQLIVSKPITDLMAMQVYDHANRAQSNGELVAQAPDAPMVNHSFSAKKLTQIERLAAQSLSAWNL